MNENTRIVKVRGFDNYFISSDGYVINRWGRKLSVDLNLKGYPRVYLYKEGKRTRYLLHRLVASHFIGDIEDKDVHHIDGNRRNCAASNLQIWNRYDHMAEFHGWEKVYEWLESDTTDTLDLYSQNRGSRDS